MKTYRCAECAQPFPLTQVKRQFCSAGCKQAFHNRAAKRGKRLVPLVMAQRQGRSSVTARRAHSEWCRLVSEYTAEDKAAGRKSMHDFLAVQYSLELRP